MGTIAEILMKIVMFGLTLAAILLVVSLLSGTGPIGVLIALALGIAIFVPKENSSDD